MSAFQLESEFTPKGDQPEAIDQLVAGVERGDPHQVLLGVTGSGKSFSVACVVERINRPTLVMAPNKTLAAQLYEEFKGLFPGLAEQNGAALIPFLLEGVGDKPELNLPDGNHPTVAGHRVVADNVWGTLGPLLEQLR